MLQLLYVIKYRLFQLITVLSFGQNLQLIHILEIIGFVVFFNLEMLILVGMDKRIRTEFTT